MQDPVKQGIILMAMPAVSIAFGTTQSRKEGCPSQSRPIDLVHLAGQTMGDKALETEVLQMFARQSRRLVQDMAAADPAARRMSAHRLQGSAKGVGAFRVAAVAEALEAQPEDTALLASLHAAVVEAENFILGLCR
jgi:HPt (histidine-containing phosphotransfer) domain-containing protein